MTDIVELNNLANKKESKLIALRIIMEGRVQRVGLRNWLKANARNIGVDGWVRNKHKNEAVEAFFVGKEIKIREIMRMIYQGGAPFSYIKRVKEFPQSDTQGVTAGFNILPTI